MIETVPAKSIVLRVKKPASWFGAFYNMNIYRGCSHGCIYCDSRSDCYHNKEFDKIKVKEDALKTIRDELRRKVKKDVVATGAMSDPYNSLERDLYLTRHALELLNAFGFGVAIDTKSSLVERDIDILSDIKSHSPVIVKMTITSIDDELCRKIEPNVSRSSERFASLKALSESGIFCGVLMMPILPFINDTEENIGGILQKAKEAGARFVYPSLGMTLRQGNREYYYHMLDRYFPELKEKYMRTYKDSYYCTSKKAKSLWEFFTKKCEEYKLLYNMEAITYYYRAGYEAEQISLFD